MKKSAYLFLLLLFVLSACENEIPYRMDTVEPKLIMNALLEEYYRGVGYFVCEWRRKGSGGCRERSVVG